MEPYRLVVVRFDYVSCRCFWPIFFESKSNNDFGACIVELLQGAIDDLGSMPGVSNVQIVLNKRAEMDEVNETFDSILLDKTNQPVNTDEVKIKYLEIDHQHLSEKPKYNYFDSEFYRPIYYGEYRFPVRVRSEYFKFMMDDIQLPVLQVFTDSARKDQ